MKYTKKRAYKKQIIECIDAFFVEKKVEVTITRSTPFVGRRKFSVRVNGEDCNAKDLLHLLLMFAIEERRIELKMPGTGAHLLKQFFATSISLIKEPMKPATDDDGAHKN